METPHLNYIVQTYPSAKTTPQVRKQDFFTNECTSRNNKSQYGTFSHNNNSGMAPGTVNNSPYNIPVHTGHLQGIHHHFTNTTRRESLMRKLQSKLESFQSYPQQHSWNREPRITSRAEIVTVWIAPLFIESKQRYSPYPPLQKNTMADRSANKGRSPVGGFARLSFQRASIPFQFRCAVKHPHDGLKTAA